MQVEAVVKENQVTEIELSYRPQIRISDVPKVEDSAFAYTLFLEKWDVSKLEFIEQFKVMLLNKANRILGICTLSTGGVSSTIIDIKLLFAAALKANASSIIIAHNHPSGELTPSNSDRKVTEKVYEAGKLLEIPLLDHLIITKEGYYSFKNEGAL